MTPFSTRFLVVLFACLLCANNHNVVHGLVFGVIGDWGLGGYASGWNTEIISTRRYVEVCGNLGCNFTISVGDNFYCGDLSYCIQHSFEEDMANVSGPFFPCAGNHDKIGGQIQYSSRNPRWYWPDKYYTVKLPIDDTGYTVQLFAVNTLDKSLKNGHQLQWLTEELRKSNARWKIIFGHYPIVGSGRHKRVPTVNQIMRLMKEYNAQAYFNGHDHVVEVNNVEGRVLAASGGMSRGAMMAHGLGGAARRFTLTSPSEYSPYVQPWASHGFMTVDLAPNTMNINVWDSNGGMHYEFVVTQDWMSKVMDLPESARNMWPPPEVVLQAMKDELTLPRGPGGGIVFLANGTRVTLPEGTENKSGEAVSHPPTPTPTPTSPPTPTPAPTPAPVLPPEPTLPPAPVPDYVRYAVATECDVCDAKPRVGKRFTVHVNGVTLGPAHRVYLTGRPEGCGGAEQNRQILPGTHVEKPDRNALLFNVSQVMESVYVCLSLDGGATYGRILREDTLDESFVFAIENI
ncbi:putative Tartrateresistant acid phosphatase type 5 [Trypanosoma grayi]|uniref:putative Tartrateresistant acid phosphatase type 5 n=1 Tax=Trypanosoma grayi TaxID=71804 RepID=UPI0004F48775|nr:putative Tartrateresistant acid phosphatase type 5 [Trypanosoma grayi]KEG14721.1 putative Tartrateresistant acid phosphatase type 5 [Trypanosoma grayi]